MYEKGLYCCTKPVGAGIMSLYQHVTDMGIPNAIPIDELHCTVQYSPTPPTTVIHMNHWKSIAVVTHFEKWKTQSGKTCLVAKLDCPAVKNVHVIQKGLMGLTYKWPQYKPHVTISYDVPEDTPLPTWTGSIMLDGLHYSELED